MEWRCMPYAQKSFGKKKTTRRRAELELKLQGYFPPEGHICLESRDEVEKRVVLTFIGGARHQTEATWSSGNEPIQIILEVDEEDVSIIEMTKVKVTGAALRSLSNSCGVLHGNTIIMMGGLETSSYNTVNEVVRLEPKGKNLECQYDDYVNMPSSRAGHTLTRISHNECILFGGMQIDSRVNRMTSRFIPDCVDGAFYHFDIEHKMVTKLLTPEVQPRCYHCASFVAPNQVLIVGGVEFSNGSPYKRLDITNIMQFDTNSHTLSVIDITGNPSYRSCMSLCSLDNKLYIYGGFSQNETLVNLQEEPTTSSSLCIIDVSSKSSSYTTFDVPFAVATAGHTSLAVDTDCIMFLGGREETIFAYTTKALKPPECDSEECHIEDSPEISPINWIQCDICDSWLHQFCAAIDRVPKGKWKCVKCVDVSKNKSRKRKK